MVDRLKKVGHHEAKPVIDKKFVLSPEEQDKAVGGAALNNSIFDYTEAGVKIFSANNGPKEYFYAGRQISATCADEIVKFYIARGRRPLETEVSLY